MLVTVDNGEERTNLHKSQALLNAIKEYETNKWKVIGQKVGKPAKVCTYLSHLPPESRIYPLLSLSLSLPSPGHWC